MKIHPSAILLVFLPSAACGKKDLPAAPPPVAAAAASASAATARASIPRPPAQGAQTAQERVPLQAPDASLARERKTFAAAHLRAIDESAKLRALAEAQAAQAAKEDEKKMVAAWQAYEAQIAALQADTRLEPREKALHIARIPLPASDAPVSPPGDARSAAELDALVYRLRSAVQRKDHAEIVEILAAARNPAGRADSAMLGTFLAEARAACQAMED